MTVHEDEIGGSAMAVIAEMSCIGRKGAIILVVVTGDQTDRRPGYIRHPPSFVIFGNPGRREDIRFRLHMQRNAPDSGVAAADYIQGIIRQAIR